jgi:hypothetical protein
MQGRTEMDVSCCFIRYLSRRRTFKETQESPKYGQCTLQVAIFIKRYVVDSEGSLAAWRGFAFLPDCTPCLGSLRRRQRAWRRVGRTLPPIFCGWPGPSAVGMARRPACIVEVHLALPGLSDNSCESAHLCAEIAEKFSKLTGIGLVTVVKI